MNIQMREFRDAAVNGEDSEDKKMDQVREILYGEFRRQSDTKVAALELRVRELELALFRRVDALQLRVDSMNGEMASERRAQFDELARSIIDLGERVKRIARE